MEGKDKIYERKFDVGLAALGAAIAVGLIGMKAFGRR